MPKTPRTCAAAWRSTVRWVAGDIQSKSARWIPKADPRWTQNGSQPRWQIASRSGLCAGGPLLFLARNTVIAATLRCPNNHRRTGPAGSGYHANCISGHCGWGRSENLEGRRSNSRAPSPGHLPLGKSDDQRAGYGRLGHRFCRDSPSGGDSSRTLPSLHSGLLGYGNAENNRVRCPRGTRWRPAAKSSRAWYYRRPVGSRRANRIVANLNSTPKKLCYSEAW